MIIQAQQTRKRPRVAVPAEPGERGPSKTPSATHAGLNRRSAAGTEPWGYPRMQSPAERHQARTLIRLMFAMDSFDLPAITILG